ncbi:TPA: glycosyltransferase [Clostridium perfringens]
MKKVCIIAQGLSDGGAERVATILANYLSEKKYEVSFIATYNDKREYELNEEIKLSFIRTTIKNKLFKLIDRNIKVYSIVKSFKPDIVVSFITNEVLLTEISGIPVIHTLRNDPSRIENGIITSRLRNYAYKHAKHIVFQTEGAREFFNKKIQNKSSIIVNPLDVRKLPSWEYKEYNFITACRLSKQKNLPLLINSFIEFRKKYPKFSLDIYGEGELRNELQDLIDSKGAKEYIHLKGHSSNIHKIMASSYAFVLSSDFEGLSNSMLEALAIGMPCICTDCPPGGARMFIENEKNGLLVPVGNLASLTDAMIKIANDYDLAKKLSLNTQNIKTNLDQNTICMKWENIILGE